MRTSNEQDGGETVYVFRPRLIGAATELELTPAGLAWRSGDRSTRIPYEEIARVRLGLRPVGLSSRRFVAELWTRRGLRLEIPSTSARTLIDTQDHGPAFRQFVAALHRRIVAAGAPCRFDGGFAAWRWWPMAAIGAVTGIGVVYVALRALFAGEWAVAAIVGGFGLIFAWQMWPLIKRNRPRPYSPEAIPEDLLP